MATNEQYLPLESGWSIWQDCREKACRLENCKRLAISRTDNCLQQENRKRLSHFSIDVWPNRQPVYFDSLSLHTWACFVFWIRNLSFGEEMVVVTTDRVRGCRRPTATWRDHGDHWPDFLFELEHDVTKNADNHQTLPTAMIFGYGVRKKSARWLNCISDVKEIQKSNATFQLAKFVLFWKSAKVSESSRTFWGDDDEDIAGNHARQNPEIGTHAANLAKPVRFFLQTDSNFKHQYELTVHMNIKTRYFRHKAMLDLDAHGFFGVVRTWGTNTWHLYLSDQVAILVHLLFCLVSDMEKQEGGKYFINFVGGRRRRPLREAKRDKKIWR